MASAPTDEWIIELNEHDSRRMRLMTERATQQIGADVVFDLAKVVKSDGVRPEFESAKRNSAYKRFTATVRLSDVTFDVLMNGRSGYRAQFYVGLDDGRLFNRSLIDSMLPSLQLAWEASSNQEPWEAALRSLNDPSAKIWPELDDAALKGQPKLIAKMWAMNCEEAKASTIGMHLFANNPPTIEVKGGWISDQSSDPWLPLKKRCRDELLRCFGFT